MTRKQPLVGYLAVHLVDNWDGDGIGRDLEERCRWRWRGRDFSLEIFDISTDGLSTTSMDNLLQ